MTKKQTTSKWKNNINTSFRILKLNKNKSKIYELSNIAVKDYYFTQDFTFFDFLPKTLKKIGSIILEGGVSNSVV